MLANYAPDGAHWRPGTLQRMGVNANRNILILCRIEMSSSGLPRPAPVQQDVIVEHKRDILIGL